MKREEILERYQIWLYRSDNDDDNIADLISEIIDEECDKRVEESLGSSFKDAEIDTLTAEIEGKVSEIVVQEEYSIQELSNLIGELLEKQAKEIVEEMRKNWIKLREAQDVPYLEEDESKDFFQGYMEGWNQGITDMAGMICKIEKKYLKQDIDKLNSKENGK